jgi:hypothetical protein
MQSFVYTRPQTASAVQLLVDAALWLPLAVAAGAACVASKILAFMVVLHFA